MCVASCAFRLIILQDFLINNVCGKSQLMSYLYAWHEVSDLASETVTYGWMWSVVRLVQSDSRSFGSSVSVEGIS